MDMKPQNRKLTVKTGTVRSQVHCLSRLANRVADSVV